ncbi:MAG: hypothetical protein KDB80_08585 [Planctomycetes bacterium]|nr:hypothetical protein [Planctomycetota bacterium]
MVGSLIAYTIYFDVRYGLTFDQQGMDALWPVVWFMTLAGLVIGHAPAWVLSRRIAVEHRYVLLRYLVSTIPLAAIAISGVVVQGADWDELVLFLIPTLPSLVAVTMLAVRSYRRGPR